MHILCLALVAWWCNLVSGQYAQNLIPVAGPNGKQAHMWQPGANLGLHTVYDIPNTTVVLIYNCKYMTNICHNADEFLKTTRGMQYTGNGKFHFDLSTNKKTGRSNERRSKSCPGSWSKGVTCPQKPYQDVFRNGLVWFSRDLEPNTKVNAIEHLRDANGKVITASGMRYTCEEFPAASWVEGGSGLGNPGEGDASTRCAAMRCSDGKGVKAEQNWQATAHRNLGLELRRLAKAYALQGFDPKSSAVSFGFAFDNSSISHAAYVRTYTDGATSTTMTNERKINLARRHVDSGSGGGVFGPHFDYGSPYTMLERLNALNLDYHEHVIPADEGEATSRIVRKRHLNNLAFAKRDKSPARHPAVPPAAAAQLNSPKTNITSHANATASEIEKARKLIREAAEKSDRLNQARYASPARNRYRLRSNTRIGNKKPPSKVSSAAADDGDAPVAPLLHITHEMRVAAALVAEVDSHNKSITPKRAVAASGSYWMEHLDRKGTVPWGDDPDYKVFRNVMDYGAVGDGVADDTIAINRTMNEGRRCAEGCNGSTIKNAIIYFPPGKYKISSTIEMPFGTQVIGDVSFFPSVLSTSA